MMPNVIQQSPVTGLFSKCDISVSDYLAVGFCRSQIYGCTVINHTGPTLIKLTGTILK